MNKLKVIFFPAWYPNPTNSIAGQFVKQHAKCINEHTTLAIYYVFGYPNLHSMFKFEQSSEDGLLVYRSYYRTFDSQFSSPLNGLLYLIASLTGYLKVRRNFGIADINHVHVLTRTAFIPFLLKFIDKTPYVITEHWSRYLPSRNTYKGFFRKLLGSIFVKQSSGISAVSAGLKEALVKHRLMHANFPIICNTLKSDKFWPDKKASATDPYTFIHISGMEDKIKNISGIINACKIVKSQRSDFNLIFIGESSELPYYEQQIVKDGLTKQITFHGHIDEGLINYYHQADAFVLFSYFENQPVVLIESFYCGLPVIGSNAGGIPEMINARNGILVKVADINSLANAMISLIDNQNEFDSKIIRDEAQQKYDYPAVSAHILSFYDKALKFQNHRIK